MFDWYKYEKLRELQKTNYKAKLIIGLGDSFTQGTGACSDEFYEKVNWDLTNVDKELERELWEQNYKNSWVNKLVELYMPDYVSINFGMAGRGNRAAVKELLFHPDLELGKYSEKIVILTLSGIERFDFIHKNFFEHNHFITMWPNVHNENHSWSKLWDDYLEHIWNDRFGALELLSNVAELETWCKANNAKLFIYSGFRPDYKKTKFLQWIKGEKFDNENYINDKEYYLSHLIEMVNWNNFKTIGGFNCMTDLLCDLEGHKEFINPDHSHEYWNFVSKIDKISKNGFITKCGHPSLKSHEIIAELMYQDITKKNII